MDKGVLISVVMCCYNQAVFIEDAIKSVVTQSYKNWELVIVDDVSTEPSTSKIYNLIKKYKIENKVKLIINEKNVGYGSSLHKGIMLSSGELICVVDADDALASDDALSIERDIHINCPEAALVYSNFIICDKELKPENIFKTRALKKGETFLNKKINISHFKMFKKSCYVSCGGINQKLRQAVDKDLNLRLEEVGSLVYVDADLLYYRVHSDNISLTLDKKDPKYRKFVLDMRKQIYIDAKIRRGIG